MSTHDYSIYYRKSIDPTKIESQLEHFDILISAFNSSDRVREVFDHIQAAKKFWLIHPEYQFEETEKPTNASCICPTQTDEIRQVNELLAAIGPLNGKRLCIDITGFMRHVLVFLIAKLAHQGVMVFTALYSEPMHYSNQEKTAFSSNSSGKVRTISGMYGNNSTSGKDYLVIAIGYDHKLISEVSNSKDNAYVYPLFAFPSLSPDMYQQSAVRSEQSGDIAHSNAWITNRKFAPANDPFATAGVLSEIVAEIESRNDEPSIYLSPLSTKVQTLGFALYWQLEGRLKDSVSLLLPECLTYAKETSKGIKRLWSYTIEL